jgi:ligand-binding sensor domain-containing protein
LAVAPGPLAAAEWTTFDADGVLPVNDVRAVFQASDGSMWFGTRGGGAVRFDGEEWWRYGPDDGLASDGVITIAEDHRGRIWLGGERVSMLDGDKWRVFTEEDVLPGRIVFKIVEGSDKVIWVCTARGVARVEGFMWSTWDTQDGLRDNVVHDVIEHDGGLWFGTRRGGLSQFKDEEWTHYLDDANIRGLLVDDSGYLWVGTGGSGVYRYDGKKWKQYFDGTTVLPATVRTGGSVWFSTEGNGVKILDDGMWADLTKADGLVSDVLYAIIEDRDGALWFGTDSGVSRMQGD